MGVVSAVITFSVPRVNTAVLIEAYFFGMNKATKLIVVRLHGAKHEYSLNALQMET
jgi:hypothetical protein